MKTKLIGAFITVCFAITLHGAELQLPTSEDAFLAIVRRAFAESNASILVDLTLRKLPNGKSVSLDSVARLRAALIARGLQKLTLERIDPPTSEMVTLSARVRTNVPASWRLRVWHSPTGNSTLFVGVVDGKLRILENEQIDPAPIPMR